MPVSHLGLPVSHISSATSFYLSALQPLGYRYIGHQGDSIGLGINDADFFLCQTKNGTPVSPTHIAFAACNRITVRECYAAALNAGGRPSGAPEYRNNDCSCFNAAVEDYDGNTIEFIFRETSKSADREQISPPAKTDITQTSSRDVARNETKSDGKSFASYASTTQTALNLASSAARTLKEHKSPTPGISRSKTEPPSGGAFVGTLLGAAAGAAITYAMTRSERDSARNEAAFASSMRPREHRSRGLEEKCIPSKKSNRNRAISETTCSVPKPPGSGLPIEPRPYNDREVQNVINGHNSSARPGPVRRETYDAKPSKTERGDRFSMKRASTMPVDIADYYIEGPKRKAASKQNSRRGSFCDSRLERHDSGVSMNSRRSRRSSLNERSMVNPRRNSWHESAANVPLPSSKATSYATRHEQTPRASKTTSYAPGAQWLPSQSRAASQISAAEVPVPWPDSRAGYTDAVEESDGLGDMVSVVPDDSISCVDFSKRKKRKSGSKASSYTSKRSEADSERTIRPAKVGGSKHSVRTLPIRRKDDSYSNRRSKKSTATYA